MRTRQRLRPAALLFVFALVLGSTIFGCAGQSMPSGQTTPMTVSPELPATATSTPLPEATSQIAAAPTAIPAAPTTALPTPESPTPESSPPESPTIVYQTAVPPTATPLITYEVIFDSVGVRQGPGGGYRALTFLYNGDRIVPLGTNDAGTWFRIELDDGTAGWVARFVVRPLGETTEVGAATGVPSGTHGALEVTEVAYENGSVILEGTTDLPDNAQLWVYIHVPGQPASTLPLSKVPVSGGSFSTSFAAGLNDLASDTLAVEVRFLPQEQAPAVARLVGSRGQSLSGPHVRQAPAGGGSILAVVAPLEVPLESVEATIEELASRPEGTPERAFGEFLAAWKDGNWQRMVQFTQKSWQAVNDDPASTLESWFASNELRGAAMVDKRGYEEEWVELVAALSYEVQGQLEKATFSVVIVREIAPFEQSVAGDWGVNPAFFRQAP